jgi:hypothetical protein
MLYRFSNTSMLHSSELDMREYCTLQGHSSIDAVHRVVESMLSLRAPLTQTQNNSIAVYTLVAVLCSAHKRLNEQD